MILDVLIFVLFALVTWVVSSEGAWGALLVLIDLLFAAILAANFWQPLAAFLSKGAPEWRFWWPYLSLMLLFIISLALIRAATGVLSSRMLLFPAVFEQSLRWLFAACAAWVFIGFFSMSLHASPLPREFLGFRPERKTFFGAAPDRHWLGFLYRTSRDTFDRGDDYVFDPEGIFIPSYASWRESYANPEIIKARITAEEFKEE